MLLPSTTPTRSGPCRAIAASTAARIGAIASASKALLRPCSATGRVHRSGSGPGTAPTGSRPWAQAFDNAVKQALAERDDAALTAYAKLPGADVAVATPDHYYPFMYALGAAVPQERPKTIYEGFQSGTISMRCVQFG